MNDLENELRELLHEDAGRAPAGLGRPSATVLGRVRKRQVLLGSVVGVTILSVVATAAIGLMALLPFGETFHVPSTTEGRPRTASAGRVSITYPADWFLTAYETRDVFGSRLALTNFDPDLTKDEPCSAMPPQGVILSIRTEIGPGATAPPWPVELQEADIQDECAGTHFVASWTGPAQRSYEALAVLGSEGSDRARHQLLEAFDTLSFAVDEEITGAGAVLASGTFGDGPWTLFAEVDNTQPGTQLQVETAFDSGGLTGSGIGGILAEHAEDFTVSAQVFHGNTVMFGGAPPQIARVEVRPEGGESFDVELLELPASLDGTVRAFVAPMAGAPRGTVTTYDEAGSVVSEVPFAPGRFCSPDQPCDAEPGGPIAEGNAPDGTHWTVIGADGELRLGTEAGDILATVPWLADPIRMTTHTFVGEGGRQQHVSFGVVSGDVTGVVFVESELPSGVNLRSLPGTGGLQAFSMSVVGASLEGSQVVALDSSCRVLAAIDLSTGMPADSPALTNCG